MLGLAMLLGLSVPTSWAAETCQVVGVTDGDTITVRCGDFDHQKVRLAEIDTPERRQPFSQRAKARLSELVFQRTVDLKVIERDRYGRLVAKILLEGADINFTLVKEGLAWCYDRYVRDRNCYDHQNKAKEQGLGLWSDTNPIPPWEWRRGNR
jgi:endonuclease YncB( thermonuclease family)